MKWQEPRQHQRFAQQHPSAPSPTAEGLVKSVRDGIATVLKAPHNSKVEFDLTQVSADMVIALAIKGFRALLMQRKSGSALRAKNHGTSSRSSTTASLSMKV